MRLDSLLKKKAIPSCGAVRLQVISTQLYNLIYFIIYKYSTKNANFQCFSLPSYKRKDLLPLRC